MAPEELIEFVLAQGYRVDGPVEIIEHAAHSFELHRRGVRALPGRAEMFLEPVAVVARKLQNRSRCGAVTH